MSSFYIYNKARERVGILQNDDSVQWLENYQSPGEVRIEARATNANLALLAEGNRIHNPESDTVARIVHTDIVQAESIESIIARAVLTAQLLDDRVVMATEKISNVEVGMYTVYSKNRRGLPIETAPLEGHADSVSMEITWNSVLEAETKLAEVSGFGFKVLFDPATGQETLKVYKGVDRTNPRSDDYVGYFGTDVGSIQNATVTSGTSNLKNVAIVAGAGEGAARTIRTVSLGTVEGEARREMHVDARDLQQEYQEAVETGRYDENGNPIYEYTTKTYSDEEYFAKLDARGLQKLAERIADFSIACDIVQNNIRYGVDYFLGDRMPVKLPEYGIYTSARITSVTRVYEKEGFRIVALLSEFGITPATS